MHSHSLRPPIRNVCRAHRQPCRKLHAVFAATNDKHCAHISFTPMADPKGNFKCQESAEVQASDLFTVDQVAKFESFVAEGGFEPNQHWRGNPSPRGWKPPTRAEKRARTKCVLVKCM